jgi:hypothetical protein
MTAVPIPAVPADLPGARAALAELTPRTAALVAAIEEPERRTAGLEWTLAETAAHLLVALRGFTAALRGNLDEWAAYVPADTLYRDRLAGMTAGSLAAVPSRDPAVLSRQLGEAVDGFLQASAGRSPHEPVPAPWYAPGATLPLAAATCLLLGEQVIHGRDLARSMGRPWPIAREHALLMVQVIATMMPLVVDPEAARRVRAVYALHVRGGTGFVLRIGDGRALTEPLGTQRVDCHLTADPVSFVLVGYRRVSQWREIARGGMLAWGRRPWLGPRMIGLFFTP